MLQFRHSNRLEITNSPTHAAGDLLFGNLSCALRRFLNIVDSDVFVFFLNQVQEKDTDRKASVADPDVPISDEEDDRRFAHGSDSDSSASESKHHSYQPKKQPRMAVGAGRRAAVAAASAKSNVTGFGAWERHTKGIGMKLLEQMGYQPGKGLGSEGQGITTPVQATQRVGKVAVGYFGSESAPAPCRGNETPRPQEATTGKYAGQQKLHAVVITCRSFMKHGL